MCELFAMAARWPADVTYSLGVLAAHGEPGGRNSDGWGIAYYEAGDVRLIKEAAPAGDSVWVRFIEDHPLSSRLVISHIRRASQGGLTLDNTHPFAREPGGRMHVFAHNGNVPGVFTTPDLAVRNFRPLGKTDSEYAFCALLERLRSVWLAAREIPAGDDRIAIVARFAAEWRALGPANFIYADGDLLFVHGDRRRHTDGLRPPGLCLLGRHCNEAGPEAMDAGVKVTAAGQDIVLFASVPLTDESWESLACGELVVVRGGEVLARIVT